MMQADPQVSDTGVGTAIGRFVVPTLASMILPVLASFLMLFPVGLLIHRVVPFSLNLDIFMWCLLFAVGSILGFRLNRAFPRREACWVWISGLAWLALGVRESVRFYHPRWAHGCSLTENIISSFLLMDVRKCEGDESALAAVFYTMPALASIAYSLGALIALRMGPRAKNAGPSAHSTQE